mmetsp:Transcript_11177/g.17278  ORF Transcript_11177/g.17278 Transcript_11177/m.17278 type:complete len:284 (-) Transcript_11177:191-1042(-)
MLTRTILSLFGSLAFCFLPGRDGLSSHNGIKQRSFVFTSKQHQSEKPKLCLIGGCPGTGKSTFGMSVALDQGILKCISTDTVRAVMRSFIPQHISPALHRSSYDPASKDFDDDPVRSWKETCNVLEQSFENIVLDSISRGQGLVLEGVSILPSNKLIEMWEERGGVATGCLLTLTNEMTHKMVLQQQGKLPKLKEKNEKMIQSFDRIRQIQDEMLRCANGADWTIIEQKIEPDPLEIIATLLEEQQDCDIPNSFEVGVEETDPQQLVSLKESNAEIESIDVKE